jgi:hypothetical protein
MATKAVKITIEAALDAQCMAERAEQAADESKAKAREARALLRRVCMILDGCRYPDLPEAA